MVRVLAFDGSDDARRISGVLHQALYVGPRLAAGESKGQRSLDEVRHLVKVLEKFDAVSVEIDDNYGEADSPARTISDAAELLVSIPEYDLWLKHVERLTLAARTVKLRECLLALDWLKAAPTRESG